MVFHIAKQRSRSLCMISSAKHIAFMPLMTCDVDPELLVCKLIVSVGAGNVCVAGQRIQAPLALWGTP
eukprot:3005536-Alexandrium_andersonii.AAC.1